MKTAFPQDGQISLSEMHRVQNKLRSCQVKEKNDKKGRMYEF